MTNGRCSSPRAPRLVQHARLEPSTKSTSTRPRAGTPPARLGFGSRAPKTTRSTPAARNRSVHGGRRAVVAAARSVTYMPSRPVRARSPAAASATTSAWRPPASVAPSPTNLAVAHDDRAHGRLRMRTARAARASRAPWRCSRERLHHPAIGARQVLAPEIADAATKEVAPRSYKP